MIKINLLPFRAARTKENIRRQVSIYFLFLILVISTIIPFHIKKVGELKKLDKDVQEKTADVAKFEEKAKRLDEIKAELEVFKKKNMVIDELQMNRYEPVKLLVAMTDVIIKDRMWFTSLKEEETVKVIEPPKPQTPPPSSQNTPKLPAKPPQPEKIVTKNVLLKGVALDNKTIADFMTGLEKLPMFSSVRLINIEHEVIRDIKLKSFEITCTKAPLLNTSKDKAKDNAKS